MDDKEKNILIKELSARLPYGIMVFYHNDEVVNYIHNDIFVNVLDVDFVGYLDVYYWYQYGDDSETLANHNVDSIPIEYVKPYLKRLETIDVDDYHRYLKNNGYPTHSESVNIKCGDKWLTYKNELPFFDYCLQNHYDYRGLIDKGLAIEFTEENNPYDFNAINIIEKQENE